MLAVLCIVFRQYVEICKQKFNVNKEFCCWFAVGTEGNPSKKLRDMLKYIENSVTENASNAGIRELYRYIEKIIRAASDREYQEKLLKEYKIV